MESIAGLDHSVFRIVNEGWVNPFFDWLMPFLSGNPYFKPVLGLLAGWLLWKGGRRGRCFVLVLFLALALGETGTGCLKRWFGRPRPFVTHPETRTLVGKGLNASMPSGHAAIWAAAAVVAATYYRRSARVMLPLAAGVGISRMYVGVHYPSDVLAGWTWGAAYGWGVPRMVDALWLGLGTVAFPQWLRRLPSLLPSRSPGGAFPDGGSAGSPAEMELHWKRLTWLMLSALLLARLAYLAAGIIDLSEDEAYQWLWSKHPALSYYSKPPFIAYAQWIGTHLFGDTELGVRFFSPLLSFLAAGAMAAFMAGLAGWRAAFLFTALANAVPLLVAGSILMTIDPLTVAFWTMAMVAGWRAIREDSTGWWLVVGVGAAGAFLSKYFSPFLWLSFAVFFVVWPGSRRQLRRAGPWLALGMNVLALLPVYLWNSRNNWVTFTHLKERGGLDQPWSFKPNFLTDFVLAEFGLWNPVFAVGILWALVAFLRRPDEARSPASSAADPRRMAMIYCLAMGLPVFLFYLFYNVRARVQPNWIATSMLPLLAFAFLWWERRHREGSGVGRNLLVAGMVFGLPVCLLVHDTNLLTKVTGLTLPPKFDLLHRVRGYREAGVLVEAQYRKLLAEGRPVMVVADHYGWAGELAFYLPSARDREVLDPLVTVAESDHPQNQLWFWPEYRFSHRKGINVLYVGEADREGLDAEAFGKAFESNEPLGFFDVLYRGRVFHQIRLHVFRNQR